MIRRNQKAVARDDDSEIEIFEDNRRTRKGTKQTRLKKLVKEPVNDDTEILAGIDLEGIPEEERDEIRRALLLSREEEKQEQMEAQKLMDERRDKHLNEGNLSSQTVKEEAESANQEIAPDDDDVTLPPDSPQPQSSLEDKPDSTTCQVGESQPTLSREDSKEDLFEFGPESTLRSSSPSLTLGMSVSQSLEVDRGESDEEMEMEEPDSTQNEENPYDRDTIIDANETQEYEMEQNLEDSGRDQTENSQNSRQGSQTSQVSQSSAGFEVKADAKKSQKSSSQTSSDSQTSGHSVTASDQPLKRHYKNVRKQKGNQVRYFATEGMDPVQCTKVIMQLFDIYAKNLKTAQSKCKERLAWGEPVKSGQHQSKSIDVKRRGQGSQYMILSDSEDEDPKRADKQVIGAKNDRLKEDDNDLPDLENRCKRRLRKGANKEAFAAETRAYDPFDFEDSNTNQNIDDADDQDFVSKSGVRKQCPKPENPEETKNRKGNPKQTKISVNDAGTMILNAAETKVTEGKGRYRRRNKEAKILVEDTQKSVFELSSDEDNEKQKETPVVIGETQGFEEESVRGNRNRVPAANEGRHVGHKAKEHTDETIKNNITTSEILKNLKENFYGNKNSVKIQSEAKVKPPHATSRKGRLKKPVTLVEDTQDMDEEIIGKVNKKLDKVGDPENLARPIRGKRKSFQLKSDSEEESIPETQDFDLSPNVTLIENKNVKDVKTDQNDNVSIATKIGNVGAAVFQKVKEYLSPKLEHNKEHIVDIDNDQVNDENSQSPVIRKKRKIYAEPNSKFEKDEGKGNDLIHDASQKVPLISSRLRGGVVTQESGVGKEREIQGGAGVKKLFSRPPSKESNASDDITASQGSSTLIDDQGDLYSTQLSEKPEIFKVRKAQRKTATTNINQSSLENISGNDDEVHILKEKKDLRRKPNLRKQVTANVVKSDNISHFFPKVPKIEGKVVTVDSDSDDSEIIFHHNKTKQTVNRNANQNSSPTMDQNEDYLHARLKTENRKGTVNIPQVTNLISEDESSNDSLQNLLPGGKDRQELSGLKAGNENGPIIPSHFMDQGNDHALSVKGYNGARPKVPRTRKVSETITSAQLERNADYSAVDKQRTMLRNKRTMGNMDEMAGYETAVRKRVHPVGRVSPVVMYPCPLCCQSFPADMIEIHASECVGDAEEEEEEEHAAFAHAINTRKLRKTHHDHLHDHHHHDDLAGNMIHHHDDEEEDIHHHHPEIVQRHLEELEMEEEQEQEEVQELMEHIASQNPVKIEDTHVKDVAKDIKISPGEPGEIQQCYICDAALPKGVLLEQHMQHCLLEAKQQQMEVDQRGFNRVFSRINQAASPDTPRTTRRQLRNQQENNIKLVTIKTDASGRIQQEEGI